MLCTGANTYIPNNPWYHVVLVLGTGYGTVCYQSSSGVWDYLYGTGT